MAKTLNVEQYLGQQYGCYKIISSEKINNRTYLVGECIHCGTIKKMRPYNFHKLVTTDCYHQKEKKYCLQCGKETSNPKFCSSSCAAKYNNPIKLYKNKKKYSHYCKKCGKFLCENSRNDSPNFCDSCNSNRVNWDLITLEEIHKKRKYQNNSRIRDLAKKKTKNIKRFQSCANCGYDKHVEVCHIKAIKSFPLTALVSEINDLNNLVGLCPNCHWEFDNNILPFDKQWLD